MIRNFMGRIRFENYIKRVCAKQCRISQLALDLDTFPFQTLKFEPEYSLEGMT